MPVSVIEPGNSVRLLSREDLVEVLASDRPEDYFIGGVVDRDDKAVLLCRGNLDRLVVPFAWFRAGRRSPRPDFEDFEVTDFGQTVRFGAYEATADAILYEFDPDARRRIKNTQVEKDETFGGALRRLRLARGLSRGDFPGINAKTIARVERGEVAKPHDETLDRCCLMLSHARSVRRRHQSRWTLLGPSRTLRAAMDWPLLNGTCHHARINVLTRGANGVHSMPIDQQLPDNASIGARRMTAGRLDTVIDTVDNADRVVGTMKRAHVLQAGANFRVAHVFLFNAKRELLLQRIAQGLRHAGQWGSSAAGYVSSGEQYDHAAARKLKAELGVDVPLALLGKTSMLDGQSLKFIHVYEALYDGPFHPSATDVSDIEFVSISAIVSDRTSGARSFTATFQHLLDSYQAGTLRP